MCGISVKSTSISLRQHTLTLKNQEGSLKLDQDLEKTEKS